MWVAIFCALPFTLAGLLCLAGCCWGSRILPHSVFFCIKSWKISHVFLSPRTVFDNQCSATRVSVCRNIPDFPPLKSHFFLGKCILKITPRLNFGSSNCVKSVKILCLVTCSFVWGGEKWYWIEIPFCCNVPFSLGFVIWSLNCCNFTKILEIFSTLSHTGPFWNNNLCEFKSIASTCMPAKHNYAFYARMTVHRNRFRVNKTNRCTEFQFYRYYYSTCFGQPFCPSSGVLSRCTAKNSWWWAERLPDIS